MEDLLSTDPQRLYTEDCAVQVLRLPGTLTDENCTGTLWQRSRTMLILAACYPQLISSKYEVDTAVFDLLVQVRACADFRDACASAMLFVNPGKILDIASKAYLTYASEHLPKPAAGRGTNWPTHEADVMKNVYELCRTFYFGTGYSYEKSSAARKIAESNFVHPYTIFRLLLALVRGMMAASHTPRLFGKLKEVFLKVLTRWDGITPRVQSCAKVTLGLCCGVEATVRMKLMASLLRELWTASCFGSNDLFRDDENLLILTPDLSSENVYYAEAITLVCNIRRKCLGVVVKHDLFPDEDTSNKRMTMLAYAVMQSIRQINHTVYPYVASTEESSKSRFKLEYAKVDGVPSDEDDVDSYVEVNNITSAPATLYGFAVWNKAHRKLEYCTDDSC